MKISAIYKITNLINSKIYVGSSKDVDIRWRIHISDLNLGTHCNTPLQHSWNLHGATAFEFEVLEYVANEKDLIVREQYWMNLTNCCDREVGYNLAKLAGSNLGKKHTEEAKAKMRACKLGKKQSAEHIAARFKHPVSEETKQKQRAASTGRLHTEEAKAKMRILNSRKRKPMSDEHKRKISEANKGRILNASL